MASSPPTRTSAAGSTRKPQKRFQFIDNSNIAATGSSSTQVRRHVMQEYMREKRWENRAKAESIVLGTEIRPPSEPPATVRKRQSTRSRQRDKPPGRQVIRQLKSPVLKEPPSSTFSVTQQTLHTSTPTPQDVRTRAQPAVKHSRKGFYLTPQSFAVLANLFPHTLPTPPPSDISTGSVSPQSSPPLSFSQQWQGSDLTPAPVTLLSAARTDPFDSLPMTLSGPDQELFDFYATVMPACSYGFERRDPRAHNWYLSVFIPEAMKSPVAFQNTILVHAANTQAWVKGLTETALSIEHRARASEMLSAHAQRYPFDTSDAAISATLSAAALEDFDPRIERRQYAWLHWRAAVQKIRDRGGPAALEQSTSLRMLINWSDYIFSGYDGHGSTFYFDHTSSLHATGHVDPQMSGRQEIAQQCEEFIVFLKCAELLAVASANVQYSPTARREQPLRYGIFDNHSPLYRLLASPNGPRYTKTGQLKQIISRLAALMTINVAIWEYRYSNAVSETFFRELHDNILHNDLDRHTSVEALLQILLSGSQHPQLVHTERPWLVGRLLKVAKRLSRPSWERLNDFLLQCLTLGPATSLTVQSMENSLRSEILNAPLASHILPVMRPSRDQVPLQTR